MTITVWSSNMKLTLDQDVNVEMTSASSRNIHVAEVRGRVVYLCAVVDDRWLCCLVVDISYEHNSGTKVITVDKPLFFHQQLSGHSNTLDP